MKKLAALLTACTFCLTACGPSNADYYETAQLYLGSGEYAHAAALFDQLGEYEDAAEYALYCAALNALSEGKNDLARANLLQIDPFKSSSRYLRLLDATDLEESGKLEEALAVYTSLGSFASGEEHAQRLREAIPQRNLNHAKALMDAGRLEQAASILEKLDAYGDSQALLAQCREEILRLAYESAAKLYDRGAYEEALSAFEALGDSLDARARALMCRSAMYQQLEEAYRTVTLATCEDLMARYAEMEDYLDSPQRLASLKEKYETNLRLLAMAAEHPYVHFSFYPTAESGEPAPVLWRVISAEGSVATLLCESVLDAMPLASATDLPMDIPSDAALTLPSPADVAALSAEELAAPATPYALAQGVRSHSDGRAWWWLADARASRSPIVWYNGNIIDSGVEIHEAAVGVRPLLKLNLENIHLTAGAGTKEDPFR